MRGRAVVVAVGLFGLDDGHKVKPSMADAALGGESIGEVADVAGTAAQYRDFQTGVVIEVDVQTGDSEVVAVVLRVGQSLREFAARPDILYAVRMADGTPLCVVLPGPAFLSVSDRLKLQPR